MKLGALINSDGTGAGERQVTGFAIDHRKVAPGTVFGAFEGARVNGEDYIADAIRSGAIAIVARPGLHIEGAAYIANANPRDDRDRAR
ncbi:MAG: UDP-N-acetylmuramoyl-L-alanyl-D-glutamate--2,6-diaminopimelate ligase, partial [Sphingomonas sp.]